MQSNGVLRDMVARGLMLMLHREGHIVLPPVRKIMRNPIVYRKPPALIDVDETLIQTSLAELGVLQFTQVRRTAGEALFNSLLQQHHYLGYSRPVGEHLKYMVYAQGRPVACLAWSSAPRHLGSRGRYIGWSAQARLQNIRHIAYNTRFLILPWVKVPHLASHILGRVARTLSADWCGLYAHPIYFLETFIEPERFRGTCYKAANWTLMGVTTGRGKADMTHQANRSIKQVFGLALVKDFRQRLSIVA